MSQIALPSLFDFETNALAPVIQDNGLPEILTIKDLQPRWYQVYAINEVNRRFYQQGTTDELIVLPTGCGKSFTAALIAQQQLQQMKYVLFLCNRDKLVQQMEEELIGEGITPLLEKAEKHALPMVGAHSRCVLASVQTLHTERLKTWPDDMFDLIVSDEAHQAMGDQWLAIRRHFKKAKHLGLTATPNPPKHKLAALFSHPYIRPISMRQAMEGWNADLQGYEKPYLTRIRLEVIDSNIDVRDIAIVKKKNEVFADYDQRELDKRIWAETNWLATQIKNKIVKPDGSVMPTVIFTPHIPSAEAISAALRDFGLPFSSISYRSQNPDGIHRSFKQGELIGLSNCSILQEGWNAPWIECVVLLHVSANINKVVQQIGRGTRLSPETGKGECLVLQLGCKADPNNIVHVADAILDGVDDDYGKKQKDNSPEGVLNKRIRERTKELLQTKEELDVLLAEKKAREQISQEDKERREAYERAKRLTYQETDDRPAHAITYDPFDGLLKRGETTERFVSSNPVTETQKAQLHDLSKGRINTEGMTKEGADYLIRNLGFRKNYKLATEAQRQLMVMRFGLDPRKAARMKTWEASQWIDNAFALERGEQ